MIFTSNIRHPKEFSTIVGSTDLARDVEAINQSIRLIVTTAKGEQFGDPSFGSRVYEYLYDYSGETLYSLLRSEIAESINSQEPRVVVHESGISFEESGTTLKIRVQYAIKYSNHSSESIILVKKEEDPWVI